MTARQEIIDALAVHRDQQRELLPIMERLQPVLEEVQRRFCSGGETDFSSLSESEVRAVQASLLFSTANFRIQQYSNLLESTRRG